ncbi:rhodanese-like domain-containing protein, partial [Arthrospira platensis SPKY1]|nr:rhodanese-like domain-containing protein [Arthrospira platensis SPKY1]
MPELSVQELQALLGQKAALQLIDVREPYEYAIANLGGRLIPPGRILEESAQIARDKMVVFYCRTGIRSARAIRELRERYGLENLYNLTGGIAAWAREIDPEMK